MHVHRGYVHQRELFSLLEVSLYIVVDACVYCVYRPSPILLACGIAPDIAINALRISIGRETTTADIDIFIQDLSQAIDSLKS